MSEKTILEDIDRAIESARQAEGTLFEIKGRLQEGGSGEVDHDLLREADQDDSDKARVNIVLAESDLKLLEEIMIKYGINNRSAIIRYLIRLCALRIAVTMAQP